MKTYVVRSPELLHPMIENISKTVAEGLPGGPVVVEIKREKRSSDQNAKLWAILQDVSKQVEWHGEHLTKEEWKSVFVAAYSGQHYIPGINGGLVFLGGSTRKLTKHEFSELIETIYAFGSERDVKWSEPALAVYADYRQ